MIARILGPAGWGLALLLAGLSGQAWAAIASLPLRLIETQELTESSGAVDFSSIASKVPPGTQHLLMEISASSTFDIPEMAEFRINGDSGNNYRRHHLMATDTEFDKWATTQSEAWVVDIPPTSSGGHSSATILLPWAFGDHYKTMLGYTSSHGERLAHSKAHWLNTDPITSINLTTLSTASNFAAGSIFRLWAVDERYRVAQSELNSNGALGIGNVPQRGEHMVAMLHARSDELATNGDRVHHVLNGDPTYENYFAQRLAAEIPNIEDTISNNARIAYVPSDGLPPGHFGESVALYPWFRDASRDRTYIFQHANEDLNYTPSQIEMGRWNDSSAITSLGYSLEAGGTEFTAESKVALYHTKAPLERIVLEHDQQSVTLEVPSSFVGAAQLLMSARSSATADYDGFTMTINADTDDDKYLRQSMGATNGEHNGSRDNSRVVGVLPGALAAEGAFGGGIVTLFEASRNDRQKEFLYLGGAAEERVEMSGGAWLDLDPITSITLSPVDGTNFKAGSTFEIWIQQDPSIPGDYNNDGTVGAADYTVWRDAVTHGASLLNDATPGSVTNADFLYWRAHFGEQWDGGSGIAVAANVPEPNTLAMLFVGSILGIAGRRRVVGRCGLSVL